MELTSEIKEVWCEHEIVCFHEIHIFGHKILNCPCVTLVAKTHFNNCAASADRLLDLFLSKLFCTEIQPLVVLAGHHRTQELGAITSSFIDSI